MLTWWWKPFWTFGDVAVDKTDKSLCTHKNVYSYYDSTGEKYIEETVFERSANPKKLLEILNGEDEDAKTKQDLLHECSILNGRLRYEIGKNDQLLREIDTWNKKYNDMFDENKQLKKVIDMASARLEYFLIGNLKYQSSQEEFIKLLNILKEVSEWIKDKKKCYKT